MNRGNRKKALQPLKDERFRKYAFWAGVGAVILSVLNIILCIKKGKSTWDVQANGEMGILDMLEYYSYHYVDTVVFKIAILLAIAGIILLCVSYVINTEDHTKRMFMIVCRGIQGGCLLCIGILFLVDKVFRTTEYIGVIARSLLVLFAIAELIAFILYMMDGNHRKTCLWITLVTAWTVLNVWLVGFVLVILAFVIGILFIKEWLFPSMEEIHHINRSTGEEWTTFHTRK